MGKPALATEANQQTGKPDCYIGLNDKQTSLIQRLPQQSSSAQHSAFHTESPTPKITSVIEDLPKKRISGIAQISSPLPLPPIRAT